MDIALVISLFNYLTDITSIVWEEYIFITLFQKVKSEVKIVESKVVFVM